jgi:hypothetical protein
MRQFWLAQELTTDEAVIAWNDGTLKDYHFQTWTSGGEFIKALYNRIYYQISLCNEFIRECAPAKLDERGFSAADKATIERFRSEARFLRALSYYHAIDLFGNVPFVDENNKGVAFLPQQISRADLFTYLETELLDIEGNLRLQKRKSTGAPTRLQHGCCLQNFTLMPRSISKPIRTPKLLHGLKKLLQGRIPLNPTMHTFSLQTITCAMRSYSRLPLMV